MVKFRKAQRDKNGITCCKILVSTFFEWEMMLQYSILKLQQETTSVNSFLVVFML